MIIDLGSLEQGQHFDDYDAGWPADASTGLDCETHRQ